MKIAEYNQMMKWLTRPSREEDYKTIKKTILDRPKPQRDAAMDWVDYNMLKWQDSKHTPKQAAKLVELENRLSKTSYKEHLQTEEKKEKPFRYTNWLGQEAPEETPKKNLNKYNATQLYNDWGSKPVKKVKVSYKTPDPITDYDWRIAPWYDLTDESVPIPKPKPQETKNSFGLDYLLAVDRKY